MNSIETINETLNNNPAVMLYFSAPSCNVCHALKPKLTHAIEENFEAFEILSIDISQQPEVASHFGVFTIPTILIFLDGKEFLRKSRNMSVEEVVGAIRRPYEIMMG